MQNKHQREMEMMRRDKHIHAAVSQRPTYGDDQNVPYCKQGCFNSSQRSTIWTANMWTTCAKVPLSKVQLSKHQDVTKWCCALLTTFNHCVCTKSPFKLAIFCQLFTFLFVALLKLYSRGGGQWSMAQHHKWTGWQKVTTSAVNQ